MYYSVQFEKANAMMYGASRNLDKNPFWAIVMPHINFWSLQSAIKPLPTARGWHLRWHQFLMANFGQITINDASVVSWTAPFCFPGNELFPKKLLTSFDDENPVDPCRNTLRFMKLWCDFQGQNDLDYCQLLRAKYCVEIDALLQMNNIYDQPIQCTWTKHRLHNLLSKPTMFRQDEATDHPRQWEQIYNRSLPFAAVEVDGCDPDNIFVPTFNGQRFVMIQYKKWMFLRSRFLEWEADKYRDDSFAQISKRLGLSFTRFFRRRTITGKVAKIGDIDDDSQQQDEEKEQKEAEDALMPPTTAGLQMEANESSADEHDPDDVRDSILDEKPTPGGPIQ